MFDFGFSEIVLTSAIALIVLGPEKLPKVARQVGNWMGRARSMARQLTEQLEREVDAEDLLKETQKNSARGGATTPSSMSGTSSAPVPFDTSYTPPGSTAPGIAPPPPAAPPVPPAAPMPPDAQPSYSAQPTSTPHGADWHPAPPENTRSNG